MASTRKTLSPPEQSVLAREGSRFLAKPLENSLPEQEADLARTWLAPNDDPASKALEQEWGRLQDKVEEAWTNRVP
jgi:hypothetical protein